MSLINANLLNILTFNKSFFRVKNEFYVLLLDIRIVNEMTKSIFFSSLMLVLVLFETLITQAQNGILINELQASNISTLTDNDFNQFSDWIEINNSNDFTVNIGNYYLTDDLEDIQKWQFPPDIQIAPNGFLLVWCDDRDTVLTVIHSNFKLNGSGEEIGLFDQNLNLVSTLTFDELSDDISVGRKPDGSNTWFYFADPTPNSSNSTEGFLTIDPSPEVDFSLSSGFYNSTVSLTLSCEGPFMEIRYTVDGSQPSQLSQLYSSPISVDSTLVIRARSYSSGLLPGKIISRSFFIMEQPSLPVVSMIINPDFLWNPEIGIYVDENIEQRTDWERSCSMEYFNTNHLLDFTIGADIRLFGNTSYYYPQKTLSVFPESSLEYQLFPTRETDKFYSFLLRSSSDDWPYTMMRDALMQSIVSDQLRLDYQAYSPSVLFINGSYWGIHNIREKINERFLETYHNIDQNNLDLIYMDMRDTTITALAGDITEINELLTFIANNDLSSDENFAYVQNNIDLDNYIDFLIAQIFFSNTSWHHNVKIWKSKEEGSKWQWLLYDLDRGMATYYLNLYSVLEDIDTTDLFFSHFNENTEFRKQFINRYCGYMNSAFSKTRIIHFIDSIKSNIAEEIPEHSLRWKNECDPNGNCGIQSYEDWLDDINILKEYTNEAPEKVTQYVMDFFNIEETADLTLNIINPGKGHIFINGIEYKPESMNWTYFKGIPLQIIAVPKTGQLFLDWSNGSFNDTLSLTLISDSVLTARFGGYCVLPSVISVDTQLSDCDAYFTQGNLTINQNTVLTIEEGIHIIVSEGDSIFVYGRLFVNGTSDQPVTIRSVNELKHWGCISASNATLNLYYTNFVNCRSAIAINGGELVFDHCIVPFSPFFYADIIAIHGTQTSILNSTFYGPNDAGKSDMIDCDEISFGLISDNHIHGTTDDGIDIGTGSVNVEIEGNTIFNCGSMGISVGESSQALVEKNIVVNCKAGIQVHSEATANIDHNTLYGNEVSILCYHYDNEPLSGGHAIITNSILSGSDSAVYKLFENSTISFEYSLSDTDPIPGNYNLNTDPMFISLQNFNFNLQELSPCINSGDPAYPLDPDGTTTDMGALFFDNNSSIYENIISEKILIYPNPSSGRFSVILPDSSQLINSIVIVDSKGSIVYRIDNLIKSSVQIVDPFDHNGIFFISVSSTDGVKYSGKILNLNSKAKDE